MQRTMAFSLVILPALTGLAGTPQAKHKAAKVVGTQGTILWKPVHLQSQRFDDELKPLGRIDMECDAFPQDEGATRIRWRFQAESEPEARKGFAFFHADMILEHEGWVRLSTPDYQQYVKAYKNFPNLGVVSRDSFIYRPKDEAAFQKAMGGIEMLGSRSAGRQAALVPQLFLLMSLDQFTFEKGTAEFMVKFRPMLYGSSLGQSAGSGVDLGEIGMFSYSSVKLLDPLLALFKEQRPQLAPGLDMPALKTSASEVPREGKTSVNPNPTDAPPATASPMAEFLRQQRITFESNRKAVKILAQSGGGGSGTEIVPVCIEVQRPDAKTIQFPTAMDQLDALPKVVLPSKALSMIRIQAHPQIAYKQANPHLVFLGEENPQARRLATTADQLPMTPDGRGLDRRTLTLCLPDRDSGIFLNFSTAGTFAPGIYALTFPPISGQGVRADLTVRDYYLFRVEAPTKR